jgi:hypothetical protein
VGSPILLINEKGWLELCHYWYSERKKLIPSLKISLMASYCYRGLPVSTGSVARFSVVMRTADFSGAVLRGIMSGS